MALRRWRAGLQSPRREGVLISLRCVHAAECERLGRAADISIQRATALVTMAQTWEMLADETARYEAIGNGREHAGRTPPGLSRLVGSLVPHGTPHLRQLLEQNAPGPRSQATHSSVQRRKFQTWPSGGDVERDKNISKVANGGHARTSPAAIERDSTPVRINTATIAARTMCGKDVGGTRPEEEAQGQPRPRASITHALTPLDPRRHDTTGVCPNKSEARMSSPSYVGHATHRRCHAHCQ